MKIRIDKKTHYKYISEIIVEFALHSWKGIPINKIDIGEQIKIDSMKIPHSFFRSFPKERDFQFKYILKRLQFDDIPYKIKYWWEATEETICLVLFPENYPNKREYVAVDL